LYAYLRPPPEPFLLACLYTHKRTHTALDNRRVVFAHTRRPPKARSLPPQRPAASPSRSATTQPTSSVVRLRATDPHAQAPLTRLPFLVLRPSLSQTSATPSAPTASRAALKTRSRYGIEHCKRAIRVQNSYPSSVSAVHGRPPRPRHPGRRAHLRRRAADPVRSRRRPPFRPPAHPRGRVARNVRHPCEQRRRAAQAQPQRYACGPSRIPNVTLTLVCLCQPLRSQPCPAARSTASRASAPSSRRSTTTASPSSAPAGWYTGRRANWRYVTSLLR
jgi:hypothetical protein